MQIIIWYFSKVSGLIGKRSLDTLLCMTEMWLEICSFIAVIPQSKSCSTCIEFPVTHCMYIASQSSTENDAGN